LPKYKQLASQPYLLMDIHVKGQHLKKLSIALIKLLDLTVKSSWLHFYHIKDEETKPIEHI
jgi:hypothetical protein